MSGSELIKGLYAAFAQGDVPGVLGIMDADIRWHEAEGTPYRPDGEAIVGPDAVLNGVFIPFATEWDGFAVHPRSYHDAGDVITVEGRYTGTFLETGEPLDVQFCHVWTASDGRITKFQQYTDTGSFQRVTGRSG